MKTHQTNPGSRQVFVFFSILLYYINKDFPKLKIKFFYNL